MQGWDGTKNSRLDLMKLYMNDNEGMYIRQKIGYGVIYPSKT